MQELDYTKIGMRIRQARKSKRWSQEELAKRCGISMPFLGHIERGTRKMSLETLVSLCRELDMDADELLWGIPNASDGALLHMWGQEKAKDADSYDIYSKIMKSVAEIMSKT